VTIENFVINNNRHVANSDGIDLMQTSNAEIRHCFLSCADDGIVLKNAIWEGCNGDMENIAFRTARLSVAQTPLKSHETTYAIRILPLKTADL
jgi:polygalacturonase